MTTSSATLTGIDPTNGQPITLRHPHIIETITRPDGTMIIRATDRWGKGARNILLPR